MPAALKKPVPVIPDEPLLSTAEVARKVGLHPQVVTDKCTAGIIKSAVKIGRNWKVPASRVGEATLPLPEAKRRAKALAKTP